MLKLTLFSLLTALLISGCGSTKLVTSESADRKGLNISPLLTNPTIIATTDARVSARDDLCIGVMSKVHF